MINFRKKIISMKLNIRWCTQLTRSQLVMFSYLIQIEETTTRNLF